MEKDQCVKVCLDIYMSHHISNVRTMDPFLKKAFLAGQDVWGALIRRDNLPNWIDDKELKNNGI